MALGESSLVRRPPGCTAAAPCHAQRRAVLHAAPHSKSGAHALVRPPTAEHEEAPGAGLVHLHAAVALAIVGQDAAVAHTLRGRHVPLSARGARFPAPCRPAAGHRWAPHSHTLVALAQPTAHGSPPSQPFSHLEAFEDAHALGRVHQQRVQAVGRQRHARIHAQRAPAEGHGRRLGVAACHTRQAGGVCRATQQQAWQCAAAAPTHMHPSCGFSTVTCMSRSLCEKVLVVTSPCRQRRRRPAARSTAVAGKRCQGHGAPSRAPSMMCNASPPSHGAGEPPAPLPALALETPWRWAPGLPACLPATA